MMINPLNHESRIRILTNHWHSYVDRRKFECGLQHKAHHNDKIIIINWINNRHSGEWRVWCTFVVIICLFPIFRKQKSMFSISQTEMVFEWARHLSKFYQFQILLLFIVAISAFTPDLCIYMVNCIFLTLAEVENESRFWSTHDFCQLTHKYC